MTKTKTAKPKRKHHSKEFKDSAVKMIQEEKLEATDAATRLGIKVEDLRRWIKESEKKRLSSDQESMKELLLANKKQEEEIKRLKMERDILKKAMAYFIPSQS